MYNDVNSNEQFLKTLLEEAVEELVVSEKKFRLLIESSVDMVTLASPDGKLLYASPALTRVLGYSAEELMLTPAFELIHPEDLAGLMESTMQILEVPGSSFFRRQRLLHKNGTWTWCEGTITNMLEEKGIHALVSNFRDITERKSAEEFLVNSEKRFRDFFENAPEGITILDISNMKFIAWNSTALKLMKFTEEEMRMRGPNDISPEFQLDGRASSEKAKEMAERALNGEKMVFEWLTVDGEGKTFIAEVRLAMIEDAGFAQLYASFVDITERKKTEARLIEQNKRLSEVSFLQSHQVRRPIANILGLISLFNHEDMADPINAELLTKIGDVTKSFDAIIREIVEKTNQINWDLNFK
ncbi:MAG: PAS domain-containing protein [Bacteroidia bacterium]